MKQNLSFTEQFDLKRGGRLSPRVITRTRVICFDKIHWRLWRREIKHRSVERKRFLLLSQDLRASDNEIEKRIGRDIWNILCSKY